MSAQILRIIAIQKLDDAFVHRTVEAWIAINASQIRMDGNIKRDANCAIAITLDRLGNHAICIPGSVCVVKDSLVASAIDARLDTLDIRIVSVVTAIAMVH